MNRQSDCTVIIPARWGSSRLPGKPLLDLAGKPLIKHVVNLALNIKSASRVIVATDNKLIAEAAQDAGALVELSKVEFASGTDRVLSITKKYPSNLFINLQGDEPLVDPHDIEKMVAAFDDGAHDIYTLCHPISSENAFDSHKVKVVSTEDQRALYFSRSAIPHGSSTYLQHLGVYGFTQAAVSKIKSLKPSILERQESLEQLRWLESGLTIGLVQASNSSLGVDTLEDAKHVSRILKLRQIKVLVCDVDGVLTDGRLYYGPNGEELKSFHARDGHAIKELMRSGIKVVAASGRDSPALRSRLLDLGITYSILGESDKALSCQSISKHLSIPLNDFAFIGDDRIDIPGMNISGYSFAVSDAHPAVKGVASHLLTSKGGQAAISEIAELLLHGVSIS